MDVNCDGQIELQFMTGGACNDKGRAAAPNGWLGPVPACGNEGKWLDDCDLTWQGTIQETSQRRQMCR